ncbi:hypothetical protein LZ30DRAFT_605005 [Colletotrichum cereale]|nr:hypothetical protein LZ30DRAFT_605005 [Colletotrichum cereale]
MAMGLQQQQHHQGSPPMFPGDFVEYGQQYDPNSDPSRQPRDEGRSGRYRRPRSSSLDDDSRFTTAVGGGGGEGQRTPDSDPALRDAVLAQAPHSQVSTDSHCQVNPEE